MRRSGLALLGLVLACACGSGEGGEPSLQGGALEPLARCLAERGVVYYGSATCSACREQKQRFGPAFRWIDEVECHPHAEGSDPERCLARGIRVTPSWLLERDGRELRRLEGAQRPEALADFAGC